MRIATFTAAALFAATGAFSSAKAVSVPACPDVTPGPTMSTVTYDGPGRGDFSFKIEYLGNVDNTFSYRVTELSRSLSHWNLLLGDCLAEVVGYSGPGSVSIGNDPSTNNLPAIKWDLGDNFDGVGGEDGDSATFSFTLANGVNWVLGSRTVVFKAGNTYDTTEIAAPVCCEPTTVIPTPAAAGLGIGLLGLTALRRGRRDA